MFSHAVEIGEKLRLLARECFELGHHGVEVPVHGPCCGITVMCVQRRDNGLVFPECKVEASARIQQLPHPVEAEAGRFRRASDALEAEVVLQKGMERKVEAVEAFEVVRLDGRPLVTEVAGKLVNKVRGCKRSKLPHRLHFQRAPQEHVLASVGDLDEGDA